MKRIILMVICCGILIYSFFAAKAFSKEYTPTWKFIENPDKYVPLARSSKYERILWVRESRDGRVRVFTIAYWNGAIHCTNWINGYRSYIAVHDVFDPEIKNLFGKDFLAEELYSLLDGWDYSKV